MSACEFFVCGSVVFLFCFVFCIICSFDFSASSFFQYSYRTCSFFYFRKHLLQVTYKPCIKLQNFSNNIKLVIPLVPCLGVNAFG